MEGKTYVSENSFILLHILFTRRVITVILN